MVLVAAVGVVMSHPLLWGSALFMLFVSSLAMVLVLPVFAVYLVIDRISGGLRSGNEHL
jgi:hypothetical protein